MSGGTISGSASGNVYLRSVPLFEKKDRKKLETDFKTFSDRDKQTHGKVKLSDNVKDTLITFPVTLRVLLNEFEHKSVFPRTDDPRLIPKLDELRTGFQNELTGCIDATRRSFRHKSGDTSSQSAFAARYMAHCVETELRTFVGLAFDVKQYVFGDEKLAAVVKPRLEASVQFSKKDATDIAVLAFPSVPTADLSKLPEELRQSFRALFINLAQKAAEHAFNIETDEGLSPTQHKIQCQSDALELGKTIVDFLETLVNEKSLSVKEKKRGAYCQELVQQVLRPTLSALSDSFESEFFRAAFRSIFEPEAWHRVYQNEQAVLSLLVSINDLPIQGSDRVAGVPRPPIAMAPQFREETTGSAVLSPAFSMQQPPSPFGRPLPPPPPPRLATFGDAPLPGSDATFVQVAVEPIAVVFSEPAAATTTTTTTTEITTPRQRVKPPVPPPRRLCSEVTQPTGYGIPPAPEVPHFARPVPLQQSVPLSGRVTDTDHVPKMDRGLLDEIKNPKVVLKKVVVSKSVVSKSDPTLRLLSQEQRAFIERQQVLSTQREEQRARDSKHDNTDEEW